jgi:hypothetical protein
LLEKCAHYTQNRYESSDENDVEKEVMKRRKIVKKLKDILKIILKTNK